MAYAVVMAGGNGTRLWPRVRTKSPKHLLRLGDRTLLERALERANALVGWDSVYVTTNESLLETIKNHIASRTPLAPCNVYTEPAVKDTGPAIGLMAIRIAAWDPDAVIAFLPADHVIMDEVEFSKVLQVAFRAGKSVDGLVVIGIPADEARTCYGYIKQGRSLYVEDGQPVYKVERFREKPNSQRAEKYVRQEEYLWNSGIVVGRADVILQLLKDHNPKMRPGLERIEASLGKSDEAEVIRETYLAFERISFDYAVLEKTSRLYMVVGDFGWEDIGSWGSLARISAKDTADNIFSGRAISIDTTNSHVSAPGKLVAAIGISDLIVIDTEDVLFICQRERDQEVKALLKRLDETGWTEYL